MAPLLGWIAVAMTFLGCEFIIRKSRWGFVFWTVANAALIIKFGLCQTQPKWDMVMLYAMMQFFTTRGLIRWRGVKTLKETKQL